MPDRLIINYKNGTKDVFRDGSLDQKTYTIKGHASQLISAWKKQTAKVWELDSYNAVLLDEVSSVVVDTTWQ